MTGGKCSGRTNGQLVEKRANKGIVPAGGLQVRGQRTATPPRKVLQANTRRPSSTLLARIAPHKAAPGEKHGLDDIYGYQTLGFAYLMSFVASLLYRFGKLASTC